jgi:hypothetical protein
MAVSVVLKTATDGTTLTTDTYAEAHFFVVREGHLFVFDSERSGQTCMGVYAPGEWLRASLNDSAVNRRGH